MTTTNLGMTIPTVGADTDNWGNDLNTDLGLIDAFAGKLMPGAEVSLASAATTDIGNAASTAVAITGTTTITSFGTVANCIRFVRFTGALTLTYNATSLILLGGASRTTAAGASGIYRSDGSGNWRELAYFDQDVSSGATIKLSSLAIAGVALGSNTFAMNGNALVGGGITSNGNFTLNADMVLGHGTAQGSGGGTLTCTGFGFSNQFSIGGFSSTDGNGFQVVCVSGGVVLSNGATSWVVIIRTREEKNFQPIADPLGIVKNIRAELGHYKTDDPARELRPFVYYEDAVKYWPYAASYRPAVTLKEINSVTGEEHVREVAEHKGVSYELYVPLLLAAIQQQIDINDELRTRIEVLEAVG
jgi:hypothetical protein